MQPNPPNPPGSRGFYLPLLINLGLTLLAAGWAYAENSQRSEALLALCLAMAGLAVVNLLAALVAAITGERQWAGGFALSVGLLLLIGLGTCGLLAG